MVRLINRYNPLLSVLLYCFLDNRRVTDISRESQDMTSEDNIVTALLNKKEMKQYLGDRLKELDESEK